MPDYGDVDGGMPPDWIEDPAWTAPLAPPLPLEAPVAPVEAPAFPTFPPPVDDELAGPPPLETYAGYPPPPPLETYAPAAPIEPEPLFQQAPPPVVGPPQPLDLEPTGDAWVQQHAPQFAPPPPPAEPPPLDIYADDPFAGLSDRQGFAAVDRLTPAQQIELQAIQESRRAIAEAKRRHQIEEDDLAQMRRNAEARRVADERTRAEEEKINADALALGKQHLDRRRWFRDASVTQKIGAVIGTLVGGLMTKPGEPNRGVKFLADIIDNDIADQKADIENGRADLQFRSGIVAREYQRTGDLYQAAEIARRAAHDAVIAQMETDRQNFDPRGTMFTRYGQQLDAYRAQVAASQEANRRRRFDENNKNAQLLLDIQKQEDARLQHRQTVGLGYAQLESAKADRKAAAEARAADRAAEQADKERERDRQFSVGGTPHVQIGPDGNPIIGDDGKPAIIYDDLRNADGSRWRAASPEEAKSLRKQKTSATLVIKNIDRILAIRGRVGGESKLLNSKESQELEGLRADTIKLAKAGTEGMSSDNDMELIADSSGVGDASSWRDQEVKLRAARARTEDAINQAFRDARYSGPAISFPEAKPTRNTTQDDRVQRLFAKPKESFDDAVRREIEERTAGRGYGLDINTAADQAIYREAYEAARSAYDPEVDAGQRADIIELGRRLGASGQDASDARTVLQRLAREGLTPGIRKLAQGELDFADRAKTPTPRGPASAPLAVPNALRLGGAQ